MGESMSIDELKEMLERAASNGEEITFEDFYFIMTKKTFAWINESMNYWISESLYK